MTANEYAQYVIDRLNQLATIVETATAGSGAEVERRYVTPESREIEWLPLLKTLDGEGIVNKFMLTYSLVNNPFGKMQPGTFNTTLVFGCDYYREYRLGTDAGNTEELFIRNLLKVQYDFNKFYALDTNARIINFSFAINIKRLQESVHFARGDVFVQLTNIQFD